MRNPLYPALALVLTVSSAAAQPSGCSVQPGAVVGPPSLHLSASSTIKVAPDRLVADLIALSNAPEAVQAQRRVNEMMAHGKTLATGTPGVTAILRDYSVSFIDAKPPHWTAQQTLEVSGDNSETLLDLAGRLQAAGLAIANLTWQVSPEHRDQARRAATVAALKLLQNDASEAAAALGVQVERFQTIDLRQEPAPMPLGRGRMVMAPAMAMSSMPPPNATPEDQDVTATVSAEVLLRAATPEADRPH